MRNTLKVQRAYKNMTQEDLANALSVSRQTINYIELNKFTPSILLCLRIAFFFGKPIEEIFLLDDDEKGFAAWERK